MSRHLTNEELDTMREDLEIYTDEPMGNEQWELVQMVSSLLMCVDVLKEENAKLNARLTYLASQFADVSDLEFHKDAESVLKHMDELEKHWRDRHAQTPTSEEE